MDDYRRSGHTKYSLKAHLIFMTKYRKKLFYKSLQDDVKQFLYEATVKKGCTILQMETDVDHVHILLEYHVFQNISDIVSFLKQYSTYHMWKYHKNVLQKHFWKKQTLWSDGYFACSIGQVSQATIEQYIRNQG